MLVVEDGRVRKPGRGDYAEALNALLMLLGVGEVTSYGELAKLLGVSPRFVGRLLKENKDLVVVPCHRVVGSKGGLTGYSLGLSFKARLLRLEGCGVVGGRVSGCRFRLLSRELL